MEDNRILYEINGTTVSLERIFSDDRSAQEQTPYKCKPQDDETHPRS